MFSYPPVKKVSVVIPVYNEQESLPELIRRTDTACATLGRQYEILLVDDGSSDDSARMLTEAAEAEGSHVVAVLLNRNYGQHSAIMAGFSHVTGDLIITLDADLQNPPEEIRAWSRRPMRATTWSVPCARTARTPSSVKAPRR
jgi:undecaprenyl-phosphate 4-deoxy-4-formamido-L-arabinose transferase